MSLTVSVLLRTYTEDRWDYLVDAMASLEKQTQKADEIVIVVDHNDALMEKVKATFPDAVTVPSQVKGSAGAWNSGIRASSMDVIAFMDDDAAAKPDWIEKLMQHYANENVVGVGGTIEPNWLDGKPAWFPEEFQWVVGCTYRGMPEEVAPVRNLIGCNMSFRRDVLNKVNGFEQVKGLGHMGKLPVGGDETEMCIRINQTIPNAIMLHEPAAHVHHKVPSSRGQRNYFYKRCYLEGRSKAVISRRVGAGDGTSTERDYVLKALPAGVARGIGDGFKGDLSGFDRAFSIIGGLGTTGVSYIVARVQQAFEKDDEIEDKPEKSADPA
ncbi:MAG: glycosyltransferase family 2 protein [Chloroflexota bacterium]